MAPRFTLPATAVAFLLVLAAGSVGDADARAGQRRARRRADAGAGARRHPPRRLRVVRGGRAAGITATLCCLVFAALVARHREAV